MKLPFGWLPGHWGLKGKTREIARAEYELEGYDRDAKVAEITHGDEPERLNRELLKVKKRHKKISDYEYEMASAVNSLSGVDLTIKKLEIDYRFGKITELEFDTKVAEAQFTGTDLELALLEVKLDHDQISEQEYVKLVSTVKGEPYIAVINSSYDPKQKLEGFEFEFDWNHIWVEQLIEAGYSGVTEEQIVQRWFEDLCRTVVLESAENEPIPFNSSRRAVNRIPREGGPTDYS